MNVASCVVISTYAVDYRDEADIPAQFPLGEIPLGCSSHDEGLDRCPGDLPRSVHQLRSVLYQWPLNKKYIKKLQLVPAHRGLNV